MTKAPPTSHSAVECLYTNTKKKTTLMPLHEGECTPYAGYMGCGLRGILRASYPHAGDSFSDLCFNAKEIKILKNSSMDAVNVWER